jgi:hypothetical protein
MQYGKDIETLSMDSLLNELEWMRDTYVECIKIGQGISTKESVYYRQLKARLGQLDQEKLADFLLYEEQTFERARENG